MKKTAGIIKTLVALTLAFSMLICSSVTADELPAENSSPIDASEAISMEEDSFPDVKDSAKPYYKPVYWASERGYIKGFSDGHFGPDENCTREQFMTVLWRLAGRPAPEITDAPSVFSDVSTEKSTYKAILWASQNGIIKGYDDGTFRPQQQISRLNMTIMLWRFQDRPSASSEEISFSDVSSATPGVNAVLWGADAGVIKGFSDGTFRPDDNCTRAQIVIMLYRFIRDVRHGDVSSSKDPAGGSEVPSAPVVSPLATSQHFTTHCDSRDGYPVRYIIIHHMDGRFTGEQCALYFQETEREVSANYCIGYDGDISCSVPEQYRSWSSGNRYADKQAISIEVSDTSLYDWTIPAAAQNALVRLIADIVSRYPEFGGVAVFDINDETEAMNISAEYARTLNPADADYSSLNSNILLHKWVKANGGTGCPGEHMISLLPYITERANELLAQN